MLAVGHTDDEPAPRDEARARPNRCSLDKSSADEQATFHGDLQAAVDEKAIEVTSRWTPHSKTKCRTQAAPARMPPPYRRGTVLIKALQPPLRLSSSLSKPSDPQRLPRRDRGRARGAPAPGGPIRPPEARFKLNRVLIAHITAR